MAGRRTAVRDGEVNNIIAVLLPIHPEWCDLIFSGRKTIEVRKTKPKLDTPFKCYIYCTQKKGFVSVLKNNERADGKVIGEFVCDDITELIPISTPSVGVYRYLFASDAFKKAACLDAEELLHYGKGKTIYGWSLLSPKIYDRPKVLREFHRPCTPACNFSEECGGTNQTFCPFYISRPPQSWCYVEDLYAR